MKTVLAPIDFSTATPRVLAAARALSRSVGGRLVVLHVTIPPYTTAADATPPAMLLELERELGRAGEARLARLQRRLQAGGTTALVRHRIGPPAQEITAAAAELKADYIVIGSHGGSALHALLVGNTASAVLKKAPCPVVVIPIRAAKRRRASSKS